MKPLATFKHISSKNANYGDAEKYLTFAHDEFTMKPTLDANGRLVPREDYRISTLNCGEEDFAVACMRSNLRYGKNQKREDVKSHHYIISFDPRDGPDNGLTVDKAQELGERFCREQFPGHQAIICTHPDGHNQSSNIHVHIVINSLRIENVPLLPYMDRPADTKAGCKHRCTDAAMEYFKSEVMPCGLILSPIWSRAESSCLRTEMRGYAHQHYSRKYAGILFMLSVFLSDQQSADSYACTPGAPAYCCRRCQRADRHSTDDGLPVHTCWLRFGRSFYISLDRLHRNGAAFQIQDHLA